MTGRDSADAAQIQRRKEQLVLLILAAVQFTTIVDFMIVMPLGPQLMRALRIGPAEFGLIVSSYTFAAGAAGLVASSVIDRFPRRTTFILLYIGFLVGTLCCALAPNYQLLVAARVVTGAFGGILGGMAMTIIGDVFPEERRGRATGSLMTGFALASVAGVPLGLVLGTEFGWHIPFIALVVAGIPALILTPLALPPLDEHVGRRHSHPLRSLVETFSHANHLNAFALIVALMIGSFSVFPFLSAFLVANCGLTEEQLPLLYVLGGGLTLFAAPIIGRLSDHYGKLQVFRVMAPLSALLLLAITHLPRVPVGVAMIVFGALMVCNVGRMIAAMALITSSVEVHRRGGFLSANSSVQHIASGIAASLAGLIVTETTGGRLQNFDSIGWLAAGSTLSAVWLAGRIRVIAPASAADDPNILAAEDSPIPIGEPILGTADEG